MGSEALRIIYYLSREGQLEEPHMLEVPLAACGRGGLHLIDVKRWLMSARGNGMPASYSWAFKRNYKESCIWQDVSADEDLIPPASEGEYILKGSKLVVDSNGGQWPTPVLATEEQDLTTSPALYAKYDGNVMKMNTKNTENTSELPCSNEHDDKNSCSIPFSDQSQKSDMVYDTEYVDPGASTSSCVIMNDEPLTNLDLSIRQSCHQMADGCHNATENGKIGYPECNAALALRQDQPPTLSGTLLVQATHVASDPTCRDQIEKKFSGLSTTENQVGVSSNDVYVVSMPANLSRAASMPMHYRIGVCDAHATAQQQSQACTYGDNTYHNPQLSSSKCTGSESRLNLLHWASCKAMVMDSRGKSIDHSRNPSKVLDTQRRIKTTWVCSHTPVVCTHVVTNVDSRSAYPIPSTPGNHMVQGISKVLSENKVNCTRAGYSDQLGVELPPTMAMSNVAGQKSAPVGPSQRRLTPRKATASKPAYRRKDPASHYLHKRPSLPVFGSEKKQQQPQIEEPVLFGVESTTSRIPSVRAHGQLRRYHTHQDSKFPLHDHNDRSFHGKSNAHHHGRRDYSRDISNTSTKVLWEELLQTTQQVFTT